MEGKTNDPRLENADVLSADTPFGDTLGATSPSARDLIAEAVSGLIYDDDDLNEHDAVENTREDFPPVTPRPVNGANAAHIPAESSSHKVHIDSLDNASDTHAESTADAVSVDGTAAPDQSLVASRMMLVDDDETTEDGSEIPENSTRTGMSLAGQSNQAK